MAETTYQQQLDELIAKHGAMTVLYVARNVLEGAAMRIELEERTDKRSRYTLSLAGRAQAALLQAEWIANLQLSNPTNHPAARRVRSKIAAKQKRLLKA